MSITQNQQLSTSGVNTALGVAIESSFGVAAAPTVYLPADSVHFDEQNKLITRQAMRKSKGMPPPGVGSFDAKGDFSIECDADSAGFLIANTLGVDTVTQGASGAYIHTMKLAQGLNTLTFSEDKGKGVVYNHLGYKLNTLEFACGPDKFLTCKVTAVGKTVVESTSPGYLTPTYSNLPAFEFAHVGVSAGGASLLNNISEAINEFTISFDNGLKPHWASTGGRFLVGVEETIAMCKGTMSINYVDDSINQILWGQSGNPSPGTISQVPLTFTFQQPAVNGVARSLTITLPAITFISASTTSKRNDVLVQSISFQANESSFLAQDDITVILTNTTAASYVP